MMISYQRYDFPNWIRYSMFFTLCHRYDESIQVAESINQQGRPGRPGMAQVSGCMGRVALELPGYW